jgi:hypothetical protein
MEKNSNFLATVSYFLITVLVSIALKSGVDRIQGMIATNGLTLTISWAIPIAFVTTLLRFFFGNLLTMISVEKRRYQTFWVFNMFFIFIEMFFFSLMSGFICEKQHYFVSLMLIVLVIDEFWFLGYGMLFRQKFLRLMLAWGSINLVVIFFLFGVTSWFGLSDITFLIVSTVLVVSAFLDFLLTFRYMPSTKL